MDRYLHDRLNIAEACVVELGTSRPGGWLHDQIMESHAAPVPRGQATPKRRPKPTRKLTAEQARKLASDLEGYDGQIKSGRLVGGP